MEIEDILKYTLTLFQDIDKRLSELRNQQSIWDIKQDELLHYIENHNIDVVVSLKNTFIDKYKNKFIEKDLIQALKNLKELEQRKNNPKYTYQYLTEELEIKDENISNRSTEI